MAISNKQRFLSGVGVLSVLSLLLAPGTVFGADNTKITTNVLASVTLSTPGTPIALADLTPGASAVMSTNKDVVTVSTNNSTGYNLSIKDDDTDLDMDTPTTGTNNIAASSNLYSAPGTLAVNTWGYAVAGGSFSPSYSKVDSVTDNTLKFVGIAATDQKIKSTSAAADGDTTEVWFGARVDINQPTGAYDDTVIYTAVAN